MNRIYIMVLAVAVIFMATGNTVAEEVEILGVKFPTEKVIEGKTLKLNGVSSVKRFGSIKILAVGLYLEKPSKDPMTVIESEQVKHVHFHYLTSRATAKRLRNGFINQIKKSNPKDLVDANWAAIEKYASWLDADMKPGQTSETVYVPGKGLTLIYQGKVKGTIPGITFAQMYYRNNVGGSANEKFREGLLGL
jgi:acylphosphatase